MEGASHTAKRRLDVPLACPPPMYIKEGEEEAGPRGGAPRGGVLLGLPVQVGFGPPFLFQLGEGGKGEEERTKEGGGVPHPPSPIRTSPWGARGHPLRPFSPFH